MEPFGCEIITTEVSRQLERWAVSNWPFNRPRQGGSAMASATKQAEARADNAARSKAAKDEKLDEALKETFPASDPRGVGCPTGREEPKARIDRSPPKLPSWRRF